ncbi:hypothetical protein AB0B52_13240 [Streptomyces griseofuscus]|uniref:hypothetical protein n=1 Tax=Streptomyces griseofuscus TaxID=146922 RepID=UPI0033DCE8D5
MERLLRVVANKHVDPTRRGRGVGAPPTGRRHRPGGRPGAHRRRRAGGAVYLALPPSLFPQVVSALRSAGLPAGSRIVLEKPRLLLDVLRGDPALSIRGDEAEEAWRVLTPVLTAWERGLVPLEEYPAGSDGPAPRHVYGPGPVTREAQLHEESVLGTAADDGRS